MKVAKRGLVTEEVLAVVDEMEVRRMAQEV